MQIKIGSCPRATPDFFDLPALLLQPGGERGVGGPPAPGWAIAGGRVRRRWAPARRGRMGVPACWGLRPPRDSTPCPRHWFGLFGLRPMGEAVAGLDSLQPGGGGETELDEPSAGGECGAPPEWWSLRLSGRGASLPANPCSFVAGHHVFGVGWASGKLSVVLHSPRTLVPSSRGTTSLGADGPPASWAWCSAPR